MYAFRINFARIHKNNYNILQKFTNHDDGGMIIINRIMVTTTATTTVLVMLCHFFTNGKVVLPFAELQFAIIVNCGMHLWTRLVYIFMQPLRNNE